MGTLSTTELLASLCRKNAVTPLLNSPLLLANGLGYPVPDGAINNKGRKAEKRFFLRAYAYTGS